MNINILEISDIFLKQRGSQVFWRDCMIGMILMS